MKKERKNIMLMLCTAILSLLGFASCDNGLCEYGTPTMDYKLGGTVSDEEGNPIEGIRVSFSLKTYGSNPTDVTTTDKYGRYEFPEKKEAEVWAEQLIVEDVDGETNGSFLSDTLNLEPDVLWSNRGKRYKKGDKHWYHGGYEVNVDVTMKAKDDQ